MTLHDYRAAKAAGTLACTLPHELEPWLPLHLSATSIGRYLACPADFYAHYVLGVEHAPTPAMLFGHSVHRALEAYHRGDDPYPAFSKAWTFSRRELERLQIPYSADLTSIGVELLSLYEADPCDDGEPEQHFRVSFPGLEIPLLGYRDLTHAATFSEHKTAAWQYKPETVANMMQLKLYSAAWRQERGQLPGPVRVTVLSYEPQTRLTRFTYQPTAQDADAAVDAAKSVLEGIRGAVYDQKCPKGKCRQPVLCGRENETSEAREIPAKGVK